MLYTIVYPIKVLKISPLSLKEGLWLSCGCGRGGCWGGGGGGATYNPYPIGISFLWS